jgi:hypothetical protein
LTKARGYLSIPIRPTLSSPARSCSSVVLLQWLHRCFYVCSHKHSSADSLLQSNDRIHPDPLHNKLQVNPFHP